MSVRLFPSGATRSANDGKYEIARFFDPRVMLERAAYMHRHRIQPDGQLRDPDNWKKGMGLQTYADSIGRHALDFALLHEGYEVRRPEDDSKVEMIETLCAIMFNCEGYIKEYLEGARNEPEWKKGKAVNP